MRERNGAHQLRNADPLTAGDIVHRIVGSLAPDRAQDVTRESDLRNDLGYHSLALVELAFLIEDAFSLDPIRREEAELIQVVGEITDFVEQRAAERGFLIEPGSEERIVVLLEDLESWDADW